MSTITPAYLAHFEQILADRLGLQCDAANRSGVLETLAQRMRATGSANPGAYLDRLSSPAELRAVAQAVTIGETYFHRGRDHFHAFMEVVLPDRLRARAAQRTLRILSAGCASGEEAYTLAMLLRERGLVDWRVAITGIDVNPTHLEKAARARYGAWSLRELPDDARARWFAESGREHVLSAEIRDMVRFEERNLLTDDPTFWQPDTFDVIFCRNVLIYFTPSAIAATLARFAGALAPGGYLFLGHSESLRTTATAFDTVNQCDTFYYQLRAVAGETAPVKPAEAPPRPRAVTPPPPPPAPVRPAEAEADLTEALELVRRELHAEAVALLRALPAELAATGECRLVLAAVLVNLGDHAEAARVCAGLLADDDHGADAHYLQALACEHAGDRAGVAQRAGAAAFLDPTFAMPHLLLGRAHRRDGDLDGARREFALALALLAHERGRRLLLYAGGFGREALRRMCSAELAGGRS